jgi:hypothetical protein
MGVRVLIRLVIGSLARKLPGMRTLHDELRKRLASAGV